MNAYRLAPAALAAFTLLTQAERRAWRVMMRDETTSRTVYGEEAPEYLAWCAAANAVCAFREANDLIGFTIHRDGRVSPYSPR